MEKLAKLTLVNKKLYNMIVIPEKMTELTE